MIWLYCGNTIAAALVALRLAALAEPHIGKEDPFDRRIGLSVVIVVSLLGRNHAAVVQILGSPLVAIVMLLFIGSVTYHMRIGMQVIIEDYVHDEMRKLVLVMLNTFFAVAVALASAYAILKLSFGV